MSQVFKQRAVLALIYVSIAASTLPFAIPSTAPAFHLVATFALYVVLFIALTQSLSNRRRVLIGLILFSSAVMMLVWAVPSFALVWYIISMLSILGAMFLAFTLTFSERR